MWLENVVKMHVYNFVSNKNKVLKVGLVAGVLLVVLCMLARISLAVMMSSAIDSFTNTLLRIKKNSTNYVQSYRLD
jgi:hypothetical protein